MPTGDDGVADSRECGGMERAGYDDACGASLEGDGAADVEIDEHSEPSRYALPALVVLPPKVAAEAEQSA